MSAYLITGEAGSGKTSIIHELARRGYSTFNTDDMPDITRFYDLNTGQPTVTAPPAPIDFTRYAWNWDIPALQKLLTQAPSPGFFGAITSNSNANFHLFKQVFVLIPSLANLKHPLQTRTANDFGKHPDELAGILKSFDQTGDYWRRNGAIVIDANPPVAIVADDILNRIRHDN